MLSKNKFIELCNSSELGLDISKLTITEPLALKNETENGENTIVKIKANMLSHGFTGSKVFYYTRLNLAKLFYGIPTTLDCTKYTTFEDALKAVSDLYQLELELEDFEVNTPNVETGFILIPKPNNYQYIGELVFKHAIDLNTLTTGKINGFTYPDTSFSKVSAELLSKRLNGTDSIFLATLEKDTPISYEAILRILNSVTEFTWVVSPEPAEYNVFDIKVKDVTHETYGNGIKTEAVFSLSPTMNTAIVGNITLKGIHYGNAEGRIAVGVTKRFTESSKLIMELIKDNTVSTDQKNKLNVVLKQKQLPEVINELYQVVYNGLVSTLPEHLVRLLAQDTPRICILKYENDYVVLHY